MEKKTVEEIRAFNRYYTGVIGLLDRHILNSAFSLPEARILYELHQREGILASGIIEVLGIDKGYLSRILDQFAMKRLITRKRSNADGRLMHIYLTEKGKKEFDQLNRASDDQLKGMLEGLAEEDCDRLVLHMGEIRRILLKQEIKKNG